MVMLGGVSKCGCNLENVYVLPLGKSTFTFNLCGNPKPKLKYTISGGTYNAESELVDAEKKMYKYRIHTPDLMPKDCGKKIIFHAEGYHAWTNESKVVLKCKFLFKFLKNGYFLSTDLQRSVVFT